jgi:hypothetical protein
MPPSLFLPTLVIDSNQIGLALRLAIALGCNLPENEQSCLPSQSAHRVRLWWTVYMLDRYSPYCSSLRSALLIETGAFRRVSAWLREPMSDNYEQGFPGMPWASSHQLQSQSTCVSRALQMTLCLVSLQRTSFLVLFR